MGRRFAGGFMPGEKLKIGIIVGSTRPGRKADIVAKWVQGLAQARAAAQYELVDLQDFQLPLLDEPNPPMMNKYTKDHTKRWAAKIGGLDGFVFVTPEYNHGTSGALKNAIDYLFKEWNHKAAGFVAYGSAGGARAVEALRLNLGELLVADVREAVLLSLYTDFENMQIFRPDSRHEKTLNTMLSQVESWAGALKKLREEGAAAKAA